MSIFSAIRDAIFGHAQAAPASAQPTRSGSVNLGAADQAPPAAQPAPAAPTQPVDVEAVLREKSAAKGNPDLNYQSSIVDLMKLLDLDSSLDARKELAGELGYTGARDGSAEMNIWLHRKVMEELAKHGGRVPETLTS